MAVQAMYALKPTPCFLGGSFMPRGEKSFMAAKITVYLLGFHTLCHRLGTEQNLFDFFGDLFLA